MADFCACRTVCVTRARSNNGDPACWRPAWGTGFDCAALFGGRARPCTRCAASLRMTRGDKGVVPNMFGSNVSPVRPPSSGAGAPPSPSKGKATTAGWLRYVVPLADFALIRRFAPPSPPGGRLLPAVRIFSVLLLNLPDESAMSLTMRDCRSSLPPGGEGGAPAPDEGETGERTHVRHSSHGFIPT